MTSGQPITRGFLFADLRGYTQYVEQHGDAAAADLLAAYRRLVRTAVEQQAGAEIRTEGDSFFVVFPSASRAVQCGLAVVAAAAEASAAPGARPLRVGVGVHAGETAETEEGLVGSAINIAARVCAVAGPNEVLVTEIVRALTRTSLAVRFTPRGSPRLKGIAEPIALYRVDPAAAAGATAAPSRTGTAQRSRGLATVLGLVTVMAVAAVAVGILGLGRSAGSGAPPGSPASSAAAGSPAVPTGLVAAAPGSSAGASAAGSAPATLVPSGNPGSSGAPASAAPAASSAAPSPAASAPAPPSAPASSSAPASPSGGLPGSSFPDPDEARLLAQLPPEIAASCLRADTQTGALAGIALRCDLPLNSEADTVWWDRPGTHARVTQIMDGLVQSAGVKPGTCSSTVKAAAGDWKLGDTFSGRLVCWQDPKGAAWIAWSYFDETLVARATRRDGDWKALYGWWENTAGFLHQSSRVVRVPA